MLTSWRGRLVWSSALFAAQRFDILRVCLTRPGPIRALLLVALILAPFQRAFAAERMTIQQLEQMLAAANKPQAQQKSADVVEADFLDELTREDALAPRIAGIELSERLSARTTRRLIATYKLGPLTQSALEILADRSALFDPPASEFLPLPPPTADEQRRLIAEAGIYVDNTLLHLPDFFATRTTARYDDGLVNFGSLQVAVNSGFHRVDTHSRKITFRDGSEVTDSPAPGTEEPSFPNHGLQSHGEFGSEAAIVLLDAGRGPLQFAHWEQTPVGPVAVFTYAVPRTISHYEVDYSCTKNQALHLRPAYHGTIAIDPATKTLVRLTLEADLPITAPISQVASVIEYAPVVLGPRRFMCPSRSLTFITEYDHACGAKGYDRKSDAPVHLMNRTLFTDYHRLGSDARILSGSGNLPEATPTSPVPQSSFRPDPLPSDTHETPLSQPLQNPSHP